MTLALGSLLGQAFGRRQLAAVLRRRTHVDQSALGLTDAGQHLVAVGAQLLAGGVADRDGALAVHRRIRHQGEAGGLDLGAAAVEQANVVNAVVAQLPVGPCREPGVVVAV